MAKLVIRRDNFSKNSILFVKESVSQIELQKGMHHDIFHLHDLDNNKIDLLRSCVLTMGDYEAVVGGRHKCQNSMNCKQS